MKIPSKKGKRGWLGGGERELGGDLRPHVSFAHQTGPVAPPVAPCPAGALVEEFGAVLERRLDLALRIVLDPSLPLVSDQPPSHKIVVVGVEDVPSPLFIFEVVQETVAFEDLGAVGTRSPGHARRPTVDVVRCRDLEIAPLDVGRPQPVKDARHDVSVSDAFHPLACPDPAHPVVLERCEEPGHQGRRPFHVVIGHDSN